MKLLKINGSLSKNGKIALETMNPLNWAQLTGDPIPEIPFRSNIELTISLDTNEFISGKNGTVWATYNLRQAEIIQNALLALHIHAEIRRIHSTEGNLELLIVTNEKEIRDAIDFIWKSESGLRLEPDWSYPEGEPNKSFEQWLNGR